MINKKNKWDFRIIYLVISLVMVFLLNISLINLVSAAQNQTLGVKFCCERTNYEAWCQNAPENECSPSYRKTPTSCEATSYCKLGCCYDSSEGICMENTPQKVCQQEGGTWADSKECDIEQCNLGCCVIGKQAAFVTLTRCKKLSSFYGLLVDFRANIGSELECISLASLSDEGACVYDVDFIKTCKFTSRQECNTMKEGMKLGNESVGGAITGNVTFYKDYLCSAEELGTNCGLTKETTCIEGRDEVYFVDTCGNPANIYDSSKVNDKAYWRKKISKQESCGTGKANTNAAGCGNCDYFSGSICKDYKKAKTSKPIYGNNICADLNCKETSNGPKKHGESWCSTDENKDSVGSRYFRHICMNSEEIIEPCADYRDEICIQDKITSKGVEFSQAACRVNRWQDCYSQTEKRDCENKDKRDCVWTASKNEVSNKTLACVPEHAPGLKFWVEGEVQGICSQATTSCVVEFEKKGLIFSGDEKVISGSECWDSSKGTASQVWIDAQNKKCSSLGDCGVKVNYVGQEGYDEGYKITTKKVSGDVVKEQGLFGLGLILSKLGITGKAVQVQVKDIEKEEV